MSWVGVSESFLGRYALAVALLATSFVLLPLMALLWPALPASMGRALFYWPQYALLPGGLRIAGREAGPLAATGSLIIAASVAWLIVSAAFVAATRRWRARWALAMLLPGAVALTVAVLAVLRMMGWVPVLDGP